MAGHEKDKEAMARHHSAGPLRRGLSMANQELVANVRHNIEKEKKLSGFDRAAKFQFDFFQETPSYSFVLPKISEFKEKELIDFLKGDLIDKTIYSSLTREGVLNWWADEEMCRKVFPMSTVGDGNCLLHAVSLAMWGFNDRLLTLRKALHHTLTSSSSDGSLKRRWMYQQWMLNMDAGGLCFSNEEWENEWQEILRLASDKPRAVSAPPVRKISLQYSKATSPIRYHSIKSTDVQPTGSFESLEEFHVFVLAHILRRPIIVVADTMLRDINGEPVQPVNFGGIYLPIELPHQVCCKFPLLLGYDSAHFSALVPAEGEDVSTEGLTLSSSIPLVRRNLELLPVHFLLDPGSHWMKAETDSSRPMIPNPPKYQIIEILSKYLELVNLGSNNSGNVTLDQKPKDKSTVGKALSSISNLMSNHAFPQKEPSGRKLPKDFHAARLDLQNKPKYYEEMIQNYIADSKRKLNLNTTVMDRSKRAHLRCITDGCKFYGAEATNYLCSGCYRNQLKLSGNQTPNIKAPSSPEVDRKIIKTLTPNLPYSENERKSLPSYPSIVEEKDLITFQNLPPTFDSLSLSSNYTDNQKASHSKSPDVWPIFPDRRVSPTAPYPSLGDVPYYRAEPNSTSAASINNPEWRPGAFQGGQNMNTQNMASSDRSLETHHFPRRYEAHK